MSAERSDASFRSREKEKRFMKRERYKSSRTISQEEPLGPGGPLCAGCGGLLARLFTALGDNVIFVAGCFILLASYPSIAAPPGSIPPRPSARRRPGNSRRPDISKPKERSAKDTAKL
jgi:hypothetical protein